MNGIGDNLYTRPIIKIMAQEHELFLRTPWPEIYSDLNVKFVEMTTTWRTQAKNLLSSNVQYDEPIGIEKTINLFYSTPQFMANGITAAIEHLCGYDELSLPLSWDLPHETQSTRLNLPERPLAVIRPNSLRKEWMVPARNCDPQYLRTAACMLKDAGYYTISIGDYEDDVEWIEEPKPYADMTFHKGELNLSQLMTLFKQADVVVGSHGFVSSLSLSAHTPVITIWGGRGLYDSPETIYDKRMNHELLIDIIPDNFCKCKQRLHKCDKFIANFEQRFTEALGKL